MKDLNSSANKPAVATARQEGRNQDLQPMAGPEKWSRLEGLSNEGNAPRGHFYMRVPCKHSAVLRELITHAYLSGSMLLVAEPSILRTYAGAEESDSFSGRDSSWSYFIEKFAHKPLIVGCPLQGWLHSLARRYFEMLAPCKPESSMILSAKASAWCMNAPGLLTAASSMSGNKSSLSCVASYMTSE